MAALLSPLGLLYGASVALKARFARPADTGLPVICVGNLTAGGSGKTPIDIGIDKNRGVICQLLNREKSDTEAQIRGEAAAPAGEDPKDNLVKIERQRSRVGCAAG